MKKIVSGLISALFILALISCGSKPVEENQPEPVAPEPVIVPAPEPEPEIEPEVEPEPEMPVIEVQEPEPEPEPVIIDNTESIFAIDNARTTAIEMGASEKASLQLQQVDSIYDSIKADAKEGKIDISEQKVDLSARYAAIPVYINAMETKATIDEIVADTTFLSVVQSLYDEGCKNIAEYEALCEDATLGAGKNQLEKATAGFTCFTTVLGSVYKEVAKHARAKAYDAKLKADEVKAGVSQKIKYTEAVDAFKMGDSQYSMSNPRKATENYKNAQAIFEELYSAIYDKRAAAKAAIEAAKKKVAESNDFALKADVEAPIREKVAGIEDEDTVLLEEDSFADPSASELQIPETIEDPTMVDDLLNIKKRMEDAK
ncbi:MAG: hypothetical protein MJ188_00655 [Treponema sp.]|nr:hypothetical protein [Treponema sp.]